MNLDPCKNSWGNFPVSDWDDRLRKAWMSSPVTKPVQFLGLDLSLPQPTATVNECEALLGYKHTARKLHHAHICREALGPAQAVAPVLAVAGLATDGQPVNHDLKSLRTLVFDEIGPPIFKFKVLHSRARPWNCCPHLDPMFKRPHWRYPGHPSFPSGHATVAYFCAYLLAEIYPAQRAGLLHAAERVAVHREMAGVHFPSDSEGGRSLAEQMAGILNRLAKGAPLPGERDLVAKWRELRSRV